ncbi:MAG: type II toxin-antitoxin system VapC family toxin [Comamonadaceae bacterium]|nr:MAG: type II toxin-antitoxin system VapC family toxin [Comamonadaceae bacterium]
MVLDSSCWLEFFGQTDRLELFRAPILAVETLVVPVVTIYEVYKKIRREVSEEAATEAAALMQCGDVIDLTLALTLSAASNGLPFADSLIYATAQARSAQLWTQDAHFEGLPGVRYFAKH